MDRILLNSVAGNFSCGDIFSIGGISGNKTLIGDISEVIVYNSTLSDADRTSVESYLYNKYFTTSSTPTPTSPTTPTPLHPSFLPDNVSGLIAWYRPESLQLNNNDAVSAWPDSSGNGYTLQQSTPSEQPVYLTSGINGLPTIVFSGGQELKIDGNLCNSLTDQATLLVVTQLSNTVQYNVVDTNPSTDSYWRDNVFGLSYLGVFRQNRVARFTYPMPTSGVHIFTLESGVHYSFYTDRQLQNTVDGNFSCGDMFGIGGVSGGKPLIGDISEVIVYNSTLSDADRTSVESYLYNKYFITTPTPTPTPTPTATPTPTPSATPTNASTPTATPTATSIPYNFSGFFQPVDNSPVLNVIKAGRSVAVKFSLGGDQGLNIFATGYPKSQQITCDTGAPLDDIEETITGPSGLSYDPPSDQYNYHWKTNTTWVGTCRQLIIRLNDGTDHVANFKFK